MNNRLVSKFEELLAANIVGEVRNLLVTDNNAEFLNEVSHELRDWSVKTNVNLIEIDEKDDSWLREIQTRELFDKLSQSNTVLLIRNYATVSYLNRDNTPRNFLRDVVVNRHYGCGNDFVPSDELTNLLFVVVINDLSEMHWREDEYALFDIMHEHDSSGAWINTNLINHVSKLYPVMSDVNRIQYHISDDAATICVDVGNAFGRGGVRIRRPIRHYSVENRTDIIHNYFENNLYCNKNKVECLILRMDGFKLEDRFIVDVLRLLKSFPNLKCVYNAERIDFSNKTNHLQILTAFELGEYIFNIAQTGDFKTASELTRKLWALDTKWARFYRDIAKDFLCEREYHEKYFPKGNISNTGLDKLFRIYLFGCYATSDDFNINQIVHAEKYQNDEKAFKLLKVRFKNWDFSEVTEKLSSDLKCIALLKDYSEKIGEKFDKEFYYSKFMQVLGKVDRIFPGMEDKFCDNGVILRT